MKSLLSDALFTIGIFFIVVAVMIDKATTRDNLKSFYEGMTEGMKWPP